MDQEEEHHPKTAEEGEGYQRKRSYRDSFDEQQLQHDDHEVVHNDSGTHGNGIDYGEASVLSIHDEGEEDIHGESNRGMKDDDHVEGRARGGEVVEGLEKDMVEREGERSRSVDEAAAVEGVTSMSKQEALTMEGKRDMIDLDGGGAVASETRDHDQVMVDENDEKKQYNGKEGREGRSEKKSRKERKRKEKRSRREKVDGDDYDDRNE